MKSSLVDAILTVYHKVDVNSPWRISAGGSSPSEPRLDVPQYGEFQLAGLNSRVAPDSAVVEVRLIHTSDG